jgi:malonyl-CoA O-methyltransferase
MAETPENIIDVVADVAANGLLERLEWMTVAPKSVLVLGDANEKLNAGLQKRFPDATIGQSDKYDLIIANLVLPRVELPVINTWRLQLNRGGLLLATTLGPDTLKEWPDQAACVIKRIDMHDVGDACVESGLVDPVMEVEYFTIVYSDAEKMKRELAASGLVILNDTVLPTSEDGKFYLTCELIYGHAWLSAEEYQQQNENGETYVSVNMLRRQLGRSSL